MMGTVVDVGDGVTQTLQVQVTTTDVATKTNQSNENEVAKPAAIAGKDTQKPKVMTVVGLNHAKVRATSGENVTLIREPENVSAYIKMISLDYVSYEYFSAFSLHSFPFAMHKTDNCFRMQHHLTYWICIQEIRS